MQIILSSILLFWSECIIGQNEIITQELPGSPDSFNLLLIPGGEFITQDSKIVKLDSFFIGTHEMTFDIFVKFMRKDMDNATSDLMEAYDVDGITRPTEQYVNLSDGMGEEGGYPAIAMTQQNALKFCQWLYLKTGVFYRLPTEAEWTYAALLHSDTLENGNFAGWFRENSEERYYKTGQIQDSSALHDMFGNMLEWTLDNWEDEFLAEVDTISVNPWSVPSKKNYRVLKGGSFDDSELEVDIWTRFKSDKKWQLRDPQIPKSIWWLTDAPFVGFRVVSPVKQLSAEEIDAFFEKAIKE